MVRWEKVCVHVAALVRREIKFSDDKYKWCETQYKSRRIVRIVTLHDFKRGNTCSKLRYFLVLPYIKAAVTGYLKPINVDRFVCTSD